MVIKLLISVIQSDFKSTDEWEPYLIKTITFLFIITARLIGHFIVAYISKQETQ